MAFKACLVSNEATKLNLFLSVQKNLMFFKNCVIYDFELIFSALKFSECHKRFIRGITSPQPIRKVSDRYGYSIIVCLKLPILLLEPKHFNRELVFS